MVVAAHCFGVREEALEVLVLRVCAELLLVPTGAPQMGATTLVPVLEAPIGLIVHAVRAADKLGPVLILLPQRRVVELRAGLEELDRETLQQGEGRCMVVQAFVQEPLA